MGMGLLLADMSFRRAVGKLIILLPKARMMTALLLGTNTSNSCLSSLQIYCNFFFLKKITPSFFWLWINACLLEICARREVFAILFIVRHSFPGFQLCFLFPLSCVFPLSPEVLWFCCFWIPAASSMLLFPLLCFKPLMPLHLLSIIWKFVKISCLLMSILLFTCCYSFIPFCCFTTIFLRTQEMESLSWEFSLSS